MAGLNDVGMGLASTVHETNGSPAHPLIAAACWAAVPGTPGLRTRNKVRDIIGLTRLEYACNRYKMFWRFT
jgi:hypothetical protein